MDSINDLVDMECSSTPDDVLADVSPHTNGDEPVRPSDLTANGVQKRLFEDVCLEKESPTIQIDHDPDLRNSNEITCSDPTATSQQISSTGTTPLGTPLSTSQENLIQLPLDQQYVLNQMVQQNGLLVDVKAIEEKYERHLVDIQSEKTRLEENVLEMQDKMERQQEEFARTVAEVKKQLLAKLEVATKKSTSAQKDLESMVMKYATSERQLLAIKKLKDDADKKVRDVLKEKESLTIRIRGLCTDKAFTESAFNKKRAENGNLIRELEKLKIEHLELEHKWKESQEELQTEKELYADNRLLIDDLSRQVEKLTKELEGYRTRELTVDESQKDVNGLTVEDNLADRVPTPEQRHVEENEVEIYKKKWTDLAEENHNLSVKHQNLERTRLEHEQNSSKLKETISELRSELSEYSSKLSFMEQLKSNLESEKQIRSTIEKEVERLKVSNSDLLQEMDLCRQKEGELLEFTERATSKTVTLQSECNLLEHKLTGVQEANEKLELEIEVLKKELKLVTQELEKTRKELIDTSKRMQDEVNEKELICSKVRCQLDEVENVNRIMKKKHLNAIKELNKELNVLRRKADNVETQSITNSTINEGLSMGSRTSSSNSLDTITNNQNIVSNSSQTSSSNNSSVNTNGFLTPTSTSVYSNSGSSVKMSMLPELDKQMLVDRIIRLQKTLAKRNEKVDFLEEHNHQLIEEMKKKTRLVQFYILREDAGALATNSMDDNKVGADSVFM